ncbi:MAG: pyridoxal phosphate-dependent aminotransferase, partial [Bacteroidota bacterium]
MFSARTDWDFQPNELTSLLAAKRLRGDEILDLTESNPTRCGFDYQPQYTLESLSTRRSLVYEPHPKGILSARAAVAEYYSRQGIALDPDHIILTAGTSEAYGFLLRLLCNGRDSVALVKPGYPLLDYLCQINDVIPRHVRLSYNGGWHLDLQALNVELAARAKAVVLVHPNNPTGSYTGQNERENIVASASS